MLNEGINKELIVTECIEVAMIQLDDKCTAENFNLLEIMLAGRVVTTIIKKLYPDILKSDINKGTIVLATLEGDVHDLGKNIVKMVLTGRGYKIIDCGKNCKMSDLINTCAEHKPFLVGISGLITSVIPLVKEVKKQLKDNNLKNIKVIAGGAALKQATAELLRVDYIGETAFDAVDFIENH